VLFAERPKATVKGCQRNCREQKDERQSRRPHSRGQEFSCEPAEQYATNSNSVTHRPSADCGLSGGFEKTNDYHAGGLVYLPQIFSGKSSLIPSLFFTIVYENARRVELPRN
jgi:hypothetical protein